MKWLNENGVQHEVIDIKEHHPDEETLRDYYAKSGLPLKWLWNTSGIPYREMGLSKKLPEMSEGEQLALLPTDGMLVKRPLLVGDDLVLTGFKESEWTEKLLFGIVTPTYWWQLPPIMREWLGKLSLSGSGYVFLVATYGTTPGCCDEDARRLLAKRDIRLDASFSVKMPDTWTPIFDLSDPEKVAKQNEESERYIDAVIGKIRSRMIGNQKDHDLTD